VLMDGVALALRTFHAERRVSMLAIADVLDGLADKDPDNRRILAGVARAISDMPSTPYLAVSPNRWAWPRPEWEDWKTSVTAMLESVPWNVFRSLTIEIDTDGAWAQITSENDEHSFQIHSPVGRTRN
jgi:hypothetical protein